MRLLYVLHQFYPHHITGTEQYVLGLAREARRRGHQVAIFTLEPDFLLGWPGLKVWNDAVEEIPVHRVSIGNVLFANPVLAEYESPIVARVFEDVISKVRPDVVHAFHLRYLGSNQIELARALGLPVVVHLMDFWFLCPHFTLLRPDGRLCAGPASPEAHCLSCAYAGLHRILEGGGGPREVSFPAYAPGLLRHTDVLGDLLLAAVRRVDRQREALGSSSLIVAPSRFLRETFAANGFDVSRVRVVPYGVDMTRFAGYRKEAGHDLRVGFIGTIAQHKGLHVLIEAFRQVEVREASLHVYGRLDDYPDYARDRRFQARDDDRIHFHGPFAAGELGKVLSGIDLLAIPSLWYENTPFVALEAMAAGIPVLASRLGGLTEVLEDGVNGLSFAPGDAGELRAHLESLARDRARVARMSTAIPRPRTLSDNLDDLERIYGDLMSETKARWTDEPRGEELGAENERLRRELQLRERQVRDLYDQLTALAARWLREHDREGSPCGGAAPK
ncbi:MAG: glycosyltransferase family 4 protein [Planctomycetota bacterium]